VYQTNRRANGGSFTYTATGLTPGGSYIVDLHFSDNFSTAAKQRQFNVAINGTQVLNNFDIFATAGGEFIANVQSFYAVADTNGTIAVQFCQEPTPSPSPSARCPRPTTCSAW
jgi:hypothetical protein